MTDNDAAGCAGKQGADGVDEVPRQRFSVMGPDMANRQILAMCVVIESGALVFYGSRHEPEAIVAAFAPGYWMNVEARSNVGADA